MLSQGAALKLVLKLNIIHSSIVNITYRLLLVLYNLHHQFCKLLSKGRSVVVGLLQLKLAAVEFLFPADCPIYLIKKQESAIKSNVQWRTQSQVFSDHSGH